MSRTLSRLAGVVPSEACGGKAPSRGAAALIAWESCGLELMCGPSKIVPEGSGVSWRRLIRNRSSLWSSTSHCQGGESGHFDDDQSVGVHSSRRQDVEIQGQRGE